MTLHNKNAYPKVCLQLLETLERYLPANLTYHNVAHTIDVANVCDTYIQYYKIDPPIAKLIRIAAISHDLGYIISPDDHEEKGIKLAAQYLSGKLLPQEIQIVNGLIRATKIPQQPNNFYEKIIADADLDYLGREDYDDLSQNLYKEFIVYNTVDTEEKWLDLQITFLEQHTFHTTFALEQRQPIKNLKLLLLKEKRNKLC